MKTDNDILMEVRNLRKWFPVSGGLGKEKKFVKAVDDVNLIIKKGKHWGSWASRDAVNPPLPD